MCDIDGTEEVSIKVEEAVDTKGEIPEAITFPPIKTEEAIDAKDEIPETITFPSIKTEQEVWLLGGGVISPVFGPFFAPERKL
jgi:hypothetical protein